VLRVDCFYDLLIELISEFLELIFCEKVFDLVSFELYCKDELPCVIPIFLV